MEYSELKTLSLRPQVLHYFHILEIDNIDTLREQNPFELYERLCRKTETPQNADVIETFAEAISKAQQSAKDRANTLS